MKKMSKKALRHQLMEAPLKEGDPLYEELRSLGFKSTVDESWIVNPFWSADGQVEVDPVEEYMMDFLEAPIAWMLGYILPEIKMPPANLMKDEVQKRYESSLISRIMKTQDQTVSSSG